MCIFLFNGSEMSVWTQACNVRVVFSMNRAAKEADIQHVYSEIYEADACSMYARNVVHTKFMCRYTEEHIRWKYYEEGRMLLGWNTNVYKLCIYVSLCAAHIAYILLACTYIQKIIQNESENNTHGESKREYKCNVIWLMYYEHEHGIHVSILSSSRPSLLHVLSICLLV